ncbi:unnamed protein product, partial [marine sediment metagenome]
MSKVKKGLRWFLLRLLRITSEKPSVKKKEKGKPVWAREIHVSSWIIGLIIALFLFWILLWKFGFEIGNIVGLALFISIMM